MKKLSWLKSELNRHDLERSAAQPLHFLSFLSIFIYISCHSGSFHIRGGKKLHNLFFIILLNHHFCLPSAITLFTTPSFNRHRSHALLPHPSRLRSPVLHCAHFLCSLHPWNEKKKKKKKKKKKTKIIRRRSFVAPAYTFISVLLTPRTHTSSSIIAKGRRPTKKKKKKYESQRKEKPHTLLHAYPRTQSLPFLLFLLSRGIEVAAFSLGRARCACFYTWGPRAL